MFDSDESTASAEQEIKFIYGLIQNLNPGLLRHYLTTLAELEQSLPTLEPNSYQAILPQVQGDVQLARKLLELREMMDDLAAQARAKDESNR